jgi:FkbH-like protein
LGKEKAVVPFCIRLSDRLGDNGIIAVVILRVSGQEMLVDTWIMSCRVLGRGGEDLTLNLIAKAAKKYDCNTIVGKYVQTQKNEMVADLYSRLGFSDASAILGPGVWIMGLDEFEPRSNFIDEEHHE